MRIALFGLGYVGCVTGACLAQMGHEVCGVDISQMKVWMINEGPRSGRASVETSVAF
jgi:GDP-mannose 6-dehydrogenase